MSSKDWTEEAKLIPSSDKFLHIRRVVRILKITSISSYVCSPPGYSTKTCVDSLLCLCGDGEKVGERREEERERQRR
jgi:hypothetical protein